MQNVEGTPSNTVETPDLQGIEIEAKALELSLKKLERERLQRSTVNWSILLPLLSGVIAAEAYALASGEINIL
jgi:hypothetical protein